MNRLLKPLLLSAILAGVGSVPAWAENTTPPPDPSRVLAVLKGDGKPAPFGRAVHREEVFDESHFRDHFRMFLRVPKKRADPSLMQDALKSAQLVATLSRNGTPYAECVLVHIVDRDPDFIPDNRRWVDFGVHVVNLGGDVKAPRGTCDTDLSNLGVQRGVPDVQVSDSISVRLVGGSNNGQVLAQGIFAEF